MSDFTTYALSQVLRRAEEALDEAAGVATEEDACAVAEGIDRLGFRVSLLGPSFIRAMLTFILPRLLARPGWR